MRILQISHFDRVGGACIAAYRQHQALLRAGVDARMWVRHKETADPTVSAHLPPSDGPRRAGRLWRRLRLRSEKKKAGFLGEIFDDRSEHGGQERAGMPDCDLINIQFSQGFLDHPSFFRALDPSIPVVVTLHEMSWLTGGCSYAGECTTFRESCGHCPLLANAGEQDFSRRGWLRRKEAFASRPAGSLHFVADSHWIAEQARSSGLLKDYPVSVIHYGLDTEVYQPLDRQASRRAFGIPEHLPVVAFCAASVTDERKGMKHLVEAMEALPEKPFLLTWGRSFPKALETIPHLHLGHIDSEHLMALTYNAADLFVMPSLEEAFGQTALEALACAVPVVAFEVGGIPDMVRSEKTGLLVPKKDSRALSSAIRQLLGNSQFAQQLGQSGRAMVVDEFTYAQNAKKYRKLYQSLLQSSGHAKIEVPALP